MNGGDFEVWMKKEIPDVPGKYTRRIKSHPGPRQLMIICASVISKTVDYNFYYNYYW